ncbi:MAG TPA: tRNA (adenosine(37)-N6)-threonylcarbamoyltransferase complex dimerization subunit type 1 TsaB [Panacibacter sp.]|nr:tRNA (adenosine(37)-N6)-threonylcarbamoyltransferase complex dimerization subunit type 1 TsaB [Panacibacter sp.]HNP43179.1 tRNA (adenosine(37)-N6)-threonylcarbamoyltransferase complex dimerization subunit type 1 TsaB [Panacibacter sp.]
MALILNIDTATEFASVCIANDHHVLAMEKSVDQKSHASFIQPAIKRLAATAGIDLSAIDAVAATAGPGSYTGLRVGLSTAKGLCYALKKPLILLNTLEVMAASVVAHSSAINVEEKVLYCPMIDARRMEVFAAVYHKDISVQVPPCAIILDGNSFEQLLLRHKIIFSGSGHKKLQNILSSSNAIFSEHIQDASALSLRSLLKFKQNDFADLAYSEPFYLKEFYTKHS